MHTYLETGTIGATVSLTLHESPHQGPLMTAGCVGAVLICSLHTVAASEVQMMTLPHTQYVIAEASTPVSGVNSQVKTVSKNERLCFF